MAQEVAGSSPVVRPMDRPANRVAAAGLIPIDLEALLPLPPLAALDLAAFLEEGLLLREKPFRQALTQYDWSTFDGKAVALYVSTDAIIPPWAYLLVGHYLAEHAVYYAVCAPDQLALQYRLEKLGEVDFSQFAGKRLLLKGCAANAPEILAAFFRRAYPYARLIFYGEACSSVPIYKRKLVS